MIEANAGRALLHAAWKRGILDAEQRERLQALFDQQGLESPERVRSWLEAGQGIDPATGRKLARCLLRPDAPLLGGHVQLALLDEGGMGSVCLAADPQGQLVVVKTMRRQLANVPEYIKRFEREIAVMRQLEHPNLVRCLDAGLAPDGSAFLALEFVPGGTLKDLAARRGIPEELALAMVYQILGALDYVARHDLVHRDIKPSNIFLDGERAVLADFGLARSTAEGATALTMEGSLVGTPHYMAPEQIQPDGRLDARCDLYALGAVLYFALTGRDPYSGARYEVMHAHCSAAVPEVRRVNDAVSEGTERIIVRAMQKKPEQRYASAAEMRRAVGDQLLVLGCDPAGVERRVAELLEGRSRHADPLAVTQPTLIASAPDRTPLPELATPLPDASTPTAAAATPTPVPEPVVDDESPIWSAVIEEPPALGPSRHSQVTMVADLLAEHQGEQQGEPADQGSGVGRSGTDSDLRAQHATPTGESLGSASAGGASGTRSSPTPTPQQRIRPGSASAPPTVIGERLEGDLGRAMAADWLCLEEVGGPRRILLWARSALVMGKMRQEPVDLCLRNYPVEVHKEACQRVSRQHARIALHDRQVVIEDLGSANGSRYDGVTLMAGKRLAVAPGPEHLFVAADTISLRVRLTHRAGEILRELPGAPALPPAACGLDADHDYDAVLITRPENAPEFAYGMLLRRLSLGGPGADLLVHAASGQEIIELSAWGGRWIRRRGGLAPGAWEPLTEGDSFVAGGHTFLVRVGEYGDFH